MVLSGLLAGEAERVASAWSAAGLEVAAERVEGDWAALLLRAA